MRHFRSQRSPRPPKGATAPCGRTCCAIARPGAQDAEAAPEGTPGLRHQASAPPRRPQAAASSLPPSLACSRAHGPAQAQPVPPATVAGDSAPQPLPRPAAPGLACCSKLMVPITGPSPRSTHTALVVMARGTRADPEPKIRQTQRDTPTQERRRRGPLIGRIPRPAPPWLRPSAPEPGPIGR